MWATLAVLIYIGGVIRNFPDDDGSSWHDLKVLCRGFLWPIGDIVAATFLVKEAVFLCSRVLFGLVKRKEKVGIVVNGRRVTVANRSLSFQDVVSLAGQPSFATVTYCRGAGKKTAGIMVDGDTVKVQDGTTFDAVVTGGA